MGDGKVEATWAVASSMMAVVANYSGHSKRAKSADDFNPLKQRAEGKMTLTVQDVFQVFKKQGG